MTRTSYSHVEQAARVVSSMLRGNLRVEVQRRNGSTALDLFDGDGCIKLLCLGTTRETYTYLRGMEEALSIIGR